MTPWPGRKQKAIGNRLSARARHHQSEGSGGPHSAVGPGTQQRVRGAFASLPDGQREVLTLARRGLSYTEIAAALGVPMSTVMAHGLAVVRELRAVIETEPAVAATSRPPLPTWGRALALFRLPVRTDAPAP